MRPEKLVIAMIEAERWARERFGIDAFATELPGEIDRNVLLTAGDGSRWVLKLATAETARDEIECQHAVLEHLEDSDLCDLVPRLVRDHEGSVTSAVRTAAGDEGLLRIVTYLPGRPLAKLDRPTAELRREIGCTLGRLDRVLASFDHPGAHRHLNWNLANILDLRGLVEALEPDLQPLVAAGLDAFESQVLPRLADLPRSIIHNDANDHNLLVEEQGDHPTLSGLIDFGDMVHTITVAEPAIACAYAMIDTDEPLAAAAELIAGYESVRPLEDLERAVLPDLIMARLCNSLILSAQGRAMAPDDEYLQISERPVAELLKRLIS